MQWQAGGLLMCKQSLYNEGGFHASKTVEILEFCWGMLKKGLKVNAIRNRSVCPEEGGIWTDGDLVAQRSDKGKTPLVAGSDWRGGAMLGCLGPSQPC